MKRQTSSSTPAAWEWIVIGIVAVLAPAGTLWFVDEPAPAAQAVFTGEIGDHGPVYRMPPVNVVAHRATELARIEREDAARHEREARVAPPQPGA